MPESTPIRIAQVLGITGTAALAGVAFSFSGLVAPRILESPKPLLLRQWKHAHEVGQASMSPLAGLCASSLLYLAYESQRRAVPNQVKAYVSAALLALSIVPYAALVMVPTLQKLERRELEIHRLDEIVEESLGEETAHVLVDRWATLNVGRAVMLGSAALLAIWTALGS